MTTQQTSEDMFGKQKTEGRDIRASYLYSRVMTMSLKNWESGDVTGIDSITQSMTGVVVMLKIPTEASDVV